jgi:glycosyltransferase involved in cell wall biosynthesis
MHNPLKAIKNIHRSLRKNLKSTFKPEVSQKKIRSFIRNSLQTPKPNYFFKDNLTITAVIPCYGHAPYLREMFESLQQQTRPADEVIFVVDSSPDDSYEILEKLIEEAQNKSVSRFKLLKNSKNIGQAASLNKGIEETQSDLILILNDDDYLLHDCIEVSLQIFEKYPNAALLGGHSLHFGGGSLNQIPKRIQDICKIKDIEIDLRLPSHVSKYRGYNDINMTHSGSSFYKSAWGAIGGYYSDKSKRLVHFSDRDFQLRMNALFPVALSNTTPLSCWRNDSSVDQGVNS